MFTRACKVTLTTWYVTVTNIFVAWHPRSNCLCFLLLRWSLGCLVSSTHTSQSVRFARFQCHISSIHQARKSHNGTKTLEIPVATHFRKAAFNEHLKFFHGIATICLSKDVCMISQGNGRRSVASYLPLEYQAFKAYCLILRDSPSPSESNIFFYQKINQTPIQ